MDSAAFPTTIVRLTAIIIWLNSLVTSALTAFKMVLRNKISALYEATLNLSWLVTTVLLVSFSARELVDFLVARSLLLFLGASGSMFLAWYFFKGRPDRTTILEALKQSPAYAASEFLVLLFMRMDVLIVALMLGQFEAGIYSPAVGIINILLLVPVALYQVVLPALSRLFSTDVRQAWQASRRYGGLFLGIGAILSIGIYFGSDLITLILGQAFFASGIILKLLSPILFLHSVTFAVAAILVATNQQAKRTSVQVFAVVTDALLNVILLPRIGIEGAAIAYVASEIVLLSGYAWLVLSYHRRSDLPEIASDLNPGTE
jgi:O-antigen/teichoic acid export membrane protein